MQTRSFLVAFLVPLFAFSQEQLGLRLERFAGVSGAGMNPAGLALMPVKWDAQLAGAAFFVGNDYGFLENSSLPGLARDARDSIDLFVTSFSPDAEPPKTGQLVANFFERKRRLYGAARLLAMGPALAMHLGERWTVGFSTALRADLMTHSVPRSLAYPPYDRHKFFEEFKLGQIAAAGMLWSSVDLHAAHLVETEAGFLAFGANLKVLQGWEGFYAQSNGSFFLTKLPGDSLVFRGIEFEGGATNTNFPAIASAGKTPIRLRQTGRGLGGDFGVSFAMPWEDGNDYRLKLGFSVLDIGRVRFSKNAEKHLFEQDSARILDAKLLNQTDPTALIEQTSQQLLDGAAASRAGDAFSIGLPLAVAAQADWRVFPNFYVAGAVVQRLTFFGAALQRPNLLAVVPRFESRWLGFSMPFSIENYRWARLGFSARLGFLTVGTDHLAPFFGQKRLTGADFYVALKVSAFRKWGEDARHIVRGGRRDGVKCYQF